LTLVNIFYDPVDEYIKRKSSKLSLKELSACRSPCPLPKSPPTYGDSQALSRVLNAFESSYTGVASLVKALLDFLKRKMSTETGVGKGLFRWTTAPVDLGLCVNLAEEDRESRLNMKPFSLGGADEDGLPIRDVVGLLPVIQAN